MRYLRLKSLALTFLFAFLFVTPGCVKHFIPGINQDQDLLVVEGLITDQSGKSNVKLTASTPLGMRSEAKPLNGCDVIVSDNFGNNYSLHESQDGIYTPDRTFEGIIGRSYTLHIQTDPSRGSLSYQSSPVMMEPVPPIDSVYYKKRVLSQIAPDSPTAEGCQVYLSTHDPENSCRYFRWEFAETWEIQIPYFVPNNRCWVTENSHKINIIST